MYRFWDQMAILNAAWMSKWVCQGTKTYVRIERLILANPTEASPASWLTVYSASQLISLQVKLALKDWESINGRCCIECDQSVKVLTPGYLQQKGDTHTPIMVNSMR